MKRFRKWFPREKSIIGMIHLPPLPGYDKSPGIDSIVDGALDDLRTLIEAGADGALVENEWDRPHRVVAAPETTAAMTRVTRAVVESAESTPVGCEILLNDPKASLAVAGATGARFVRMDYFVDRMHRREYGEFAIDPDALIRYRASIGAGDVLVLADIQVKYAEMVVPRPLEHSADLALEKGADAIVVTGSVTGEPPSVDELKRASVGLPVLVGSGLAPSNAEELLEACDGAIVGTSIMTNGRVDLDAATKLITSAGKARR